MHVYVTRTGSIYEVDRFAPERSRVVIGGIHATARIRRVGGHPSSRHIDHRWRDAVEIVDTGLGLLIVWGIEESNGRRVVRTTQTSPIISEARVPAVESS